MKLAKLATAAAALGLVTAPVAAQAADATRAAAPATASSELFGDNDDAAVVGALFALAAIVIFIFAADGEDVVSP